MEHIGEPIHLVHTHVYKAPLKKVIQENSTSRGVQGSNAKQTRCNNARGARSRNANATCARNQNVNAHVDENGNATSQTAMEESFLREIILC